MVIVPTEGAARAPQDTDDIIPINHHLHGNQLCVLTNHQVWLQWDPGSSASHPSLQVYGLQGPQSQQGG